MHNRNKIIFCAYVKNVSSFLMKQGGNHNQLFVPKSRLSLLSVQSSKAFQKLVQRMMFILLSSIRLLFNLQGENMVGKVLKQQQPIQTQTILLKYKYLICRDICWIANAYSEHLKFLSATEKKTVINQLGDKST